MNQIKHALLQNFIFFHFEHHSSAFVFNKPNLHRSRFSGGSIGFMIGLLFKKDEISTSVFAISIIYTLIKLFICEQIGSYLMGSHERLFTIEI